MRPPGWARRPEVFCGNLVEVRGNHDFLVTGDLTIRGVTRRVSLNVRYPGRWDLVGGRRRQGAEKTRGALPAVNLMYYEARLMAKHWYATFDPLLSPDEARAMVSVCERFGS